MARSPGAETESKTVGHPAGGQHEPFSGERGRGPHGRWLDWIAFSNLLPATIAAVLTLAASRALGGGDHLAAARPLAWATLAGCGAFVIYGVDRLRDTRRDASTSPLRTAFVDRHRHWLAAAVALAAGGLALGLARSPARVGLLCLAVGAVGLLHRRLKHFVPFAGRAAGRAEPASRALSGPGAVSGTDSRSTFKALYVSLAWVAICVGVPWLEAGGGRPGAIAGVLLAALFANLVASNLRDDEAPLLAGPPQRTLMAARGAALAGALLAGLGPDGLTPLIWIPLAEWGALAAFRRSERYGLLVVDGALLVGALASLAHFAAR